MTFSKRNRKASKLNGVQVLQIRDKYNQLGYTQGRLAREYQVSIGTIFNIVNGISWQDIKVDDREWVEEVVPGVRTPSDDEVMASQARLIRMMEEDKARHPPVSREVAEKAKAYGALERMEDDIGKAKEPDRLLNELLEGDSK